MRIFTLSRLLVPLLFCCVCCGCSTRKQTVSAIQEDRAVRTAITGRSEMSASDSASLIRTLNLDSIEVIVERPIILEEKPDTILMTRLRFTARALASTSSASHKKDSAQLKSKRAMTDSKAKTAIHDKSESETASVLNVRNVCSITVLIFVLCVVVIIARRISR